MSKNVSLKNKIIVLLLAVLAVCTVCFISTFNGGSAKAASVQDWQAKAISGTADNIWTKDGGTITVSRTTKQGQIYVADNDNYRGSYGLDATFVGSDILDIDTTRIEYGFTAHYDNANNYINVYLVWDNSLSTVGVAGVGVNGKLGGEPISSKQNGGINNSYGERIISLASNETFRLLQPCDIIRLSVEKEFSHLYNCYQFTISIAMGAEALVEIGEVVITNYTEKNGDNTTSLGLYAYNQELEINNVSIDCDTYADTSNYTVDGWELNNPASYTWSYNQKKDRLIVHGNQGTAWKQTYAVKNGTCGTSYYMGAKVTGYYTANVEQSATYEMKVGFFPYYASGNDHVYVFLSQWSNSGDVNLVVASWLNGGAPSSGEFKSTRVSVDLFAENYVEIQISGDDVSIYLNKAKDPAFTTSVSGLGGRMNSTTVKYGVGSHNASAKYENVRQSTSRIYGEDASTNPIIEIRNYTQIAKVNSPCYIDARAFNQYGHDMDLTVTCTAPNKSSVEVVDNSYFLATKEGNYNLTLTATNAYGAETVEELTVRVVSADTEIYTVQFIASGATKFMPDVQAVVGEQFNLPENAYEYGYHIFLGWTFEEGKAVAFTDGATVQDLITTDGGVVKLYAVWSPDRIFDDAVEDDGGDDSGNNGGTNAPSTDENKGSGCGSEIDLTTTVLGVLIVGAGALLVKKARKDS